MSVSLIVATGIMTSTIRLQHQTRYNRMLQYLTSRALQLNQEFAFMPTAPPHNHGGVFELRSYQVRPHSIVYLSFGDLGS